MTKGQNALTEVESKELLKRAGIPVVATKLARSKREALSISKEMGFPVVLKICSHDVVHKTDSGGVRLGLANAAQAGRAYSEILSSVRQAHPESRIQGVSVQPMAPPAVEVIVGMSKDPQFGPVLMFGLGGILVEVLKDVSFRIVPVSERDAGEMVREIKGYPILKGYRGQKPASIPALEKLIVKVSQFVEKNPQIEELDLNPVFAYPDKAVAMDARIILE
ncbi:MAG: acetyl-CoA synthetase [Dehalococcoidia bacterium]|nr:MAG: acetyl-CoA synthetase [Dehalococcoidia bacterium]